MSSAVLWCLVADAVSDTRPEPGDEPWMTVAEFAEAIRVRPVTVRSWITKGQLKATRAGQRKWLIRPSELRRMLHEDAALSPPPELYDGTVQEAAERARERAEVDHGVASYEWEIALEQSRMAPPDARFALRIRQVAQAAGWRASSICARLHEPDYAWTPADGAVGMTLSYELRPGGNRPGPNDGWEEFDRIVARLGTAMEGTSASAVASVLDDLARAMRNLADAIERGPVGRATD